MISNRDRIVGCLLGTAVGDAIGLPYEGISRRRAQRLLGEPDRHRLLFGRGMVSDDTEHTCMVAQALIASRCDPNRFARSMGWRLRFWLLGIPAGIGFATLRSLLRLWVGYSPSHSGVYSAGNGPAMRAAILGAAVDDQELLLSLVATSTRITHSDPKAMYAAQAIALAAYVVRSDRYSTPLEYVAFLDRTLPSEAEQLMDLIRQAQVSADAGQTTEDFSATIGHAKGVSGYAYQSVPVAIHAWFSHPDNVEEGIKSVVRCGGDTDTVAAMVGGVIGASVGRSGIPETWVQNLVDYPRSTTWIEQLGERLSESLSQPNSTTTLRLPLLPLLVRNLFFVCVVLVHGFRRLFPPY